MKSVNFAAVVVFAIAFFYIFNLTVDVNPNWESHLFIEGRANKQLITIFSELMHIGLDEILGSHGPFNSLYYKSLFYFFGYDFFFYRIVKSLFFAGAIAMFFLISSRFLEKKYAFAASFFILFSLPIFIQTLVFDEGFIIGEFFKLIAVYLFIKDLSKPKTSIAAQILIGIFIMLAIQTYTSAFSVVGIFFIYLLFRHREKIRRYVLLLAIIVLTKLPISGSLPHFSESSYGLKSSIVWNFFFGDALRYLISPVPVFSNLYYKPAVSLIGFFGLWLLVIVVLILSFRKFIYKYSSKYFKKIEIDKNKKDALIFFSIWTVCEIPILLVLPETAIRYFASILTPFIGIFCLLFQESIGCVKAYKKKVIFIFWALFFISIATNLAYVMLFRATWGSAFLGMDKTGNYVLQSALKEGKNATLYYYATSVAPEYITVDRRSTDVYMISGKMIPTRMELNSFSPEFLEKQIGPNNSIYVVKRVSSFGNSEYPPLDLSDFKNLKEVKIIEGRGNNLFDMSFGAMTSVFGLPYSPNRFYIYKFIDNTR